MRNPLRKQKVDVAATHDQAGVVDVADIDVEKTKVSNPLHPDGKALSKDAAEYVLKVREARANARREMRSGNPAKRAAAAVVYRTAPRIIHAVYAKEARA